MAKPDRQMALIAFMQAQNCSNYVGSWRHPASTPDFTTPEYYQRIARTLEDGRFDLAFFDDRLAMPDIYGADHRATVENGIRAVKLDPTPVMMAMAAVTTHLGLGATYSTTYSAPYHVARLFATMDLMTRGRVAWNIVTSLNDSEAENFGQTEHLEHDLRYDRADARAGRSPCRARRRAIPCCCRRVQAAVASVSPAAGPSWCLPAMATWKAAGSSMPACARRPRLPGAIRTA